MSGPRKIKRKGKITRKAWNAIDRQAFADGVRVRAQTIPAKPKEGPRKEEWK